jgi:hypothetical protein
MTQFEIRPTSSVCSNTNPRKMDFVLSSGIKVPIQFDLQRTVLSSRRKVPIQFDLQRTVLSSRTKVPIQPGL